MTYDCTCCHKTFSTIEEITAHYEEMKDATPTGDSMNTKQLTELAYTSAMLSDLSRQMGSGDIPVDLERLKAQVEKINKQLEGE